MSIPNQLLIKALNHVARHERWVAERLRPFSGGQVGITLGGFALGLSIDADGRFAARNPAEPETVSISLPENAPALALSDPARIFASAKVAGPADFAEAIGFVFRNIKWDAEADLAGIFGDIAAHRAYKVGKHLFAQARHSSGKVLGNVAEYLRDESAIVVPTEEVQRFVADLDSVSEELIRLERRINQL